MTTTVTGGMRNSLRSISELRSLEPAFDGQQFDVKGFWPDTGVGGGLFYWDETISKTKHNGGTVIDPDKISQLGALGVFGAYFTPAVSGAGCFVRRGRWEWSLGVQAEGSVSITWFGAYGNGAAGVDNTQPIQAAINSVINGKVLTPSGQYRITEKISQNASNVVVIGDGKDSTIIIPTGTMQTAWEINNGSWDDVTKTYTSSGSSIGAAALENITISGYSIASCDGLAMARATLGCYLRSVKITGFNGVGLRTYGCWYSNAYDVILENNTRNWSYGYENNDFSMFGCDFISNPANQSEAHVDYLGGTNRNMNFFGCGWDGLPTIHGAFWKGVHNLNFFGGYLEVYNDEVVKTANFFKFGQQVIGVTAHGVNLIAGTGYSGTWLKLGDSPTDFANVVSIDSCFQIDGDTNTSVAVDTTNARNVKLGTNRFEKAIVISSTDEITPETASQTFIPAVLGTDEVAVPICTIRKLISIPVTRIRLTVLRSGTTMATQYMRIRNKATGDVLINFPMPTTLTSGDYFDLTDDSLSGYVTASKEPAINSVFANDTVLEAYTYKVGGSKDWPEMMITVEQV